MAEVVAQLEKQLESERKELAYARLKIQVLEERLRLVRIQKYGPSSEKLSNLQLELLEQEPGVSQEEVVAESERKAPPPVTEQKKRKHPGRQTLPANLPRVERVIACTPEQRVCGSCGAETGVYRRQLYDQHQLAVVHAPDDDEISERDRRPGDAKFSSAAVGIVVAMALIRGIKRTASGTIGNFWVDMTRTLLYVLLPGSLIYALLLVGQGVPQNLKAYTQAHTLEGQTQTIGQGPVASQEAIKMLGTNGGGFFNANSAHPFENPTPLSNYLQMLSIFIIPAGLTYTLGRLTGSPGHGWAVLAAMFILFAAGFTTVYWAESQPHPLIHGAQQTHTMEAPGGNMEGKEVRNGIAESALFATVTTDASCGAVNSMHDSFTPLGGMVVLINIMMGEVIFGGVGSGLYGILIMVVLAVFIAGLMVGRTPEYLGKKIEAYDVKMSMLYVLIFPIIILVSDGGFCDGAEYRPEQPEQSGAARIDGDSLRFYLRRGQQRLGLCGAQRQHLVVQRGAGLGYALRAALHDDSGAGAGRQSGAEEERASVAGNLSGEWLPVYGAAGGRDSDSERADFLPGAEPRADTGAFGSQGRQCARLF